MGWYIWRLLRMGKTRNAERVARAYVRARPRDRDGWLMLVNVLTNVDAGKQRIESALRDGLTALHNDPVIGAKLAGLLATDRRLPDAIGLLDDLVQRWPESASVRKERGYVALLKGDVVYARQQLEEALLRLRDGDEASLFSEICAGIAFTPSGEERARALLEERMTVSDSPHEIALLGVLLEERDPARSESVLAEARQKWRAPSDFDDMLNNLRSGLRYRPSQG